MIVIIFTITALTPYILKYPKLIGNLCNTQLALLVPLLPPHSEHISYKSALCIPSLPQRLILLRTTYVPEVSFFHSLNAREFDSFSLISIRKAELTSCLVLFKNQADFLSTLPTNTQCCKRDKTSRGCQSPW